MDNLSDSSVDFTALRDEILSDFTVLPQENVDVSNIVFMISNSLVKNPDHWYITQYLEVLLK